MLNFDFLDKGLRIVSPAHFLCMICKEKYFSCYILLTDHILLSGCRLLLEILGNVCIAIVFYSGCDIMYFEINLIFVIELFFYMTEKS